MSRKATPAGIAKRNRAFRHNSYLGFTSMTIRQMTAIMQSDTTTKEAKEKASSVIDRCCELSELLKIRVD